MGGLFEMRWLLPDLGGRSRSQEAQKVQYTVPRRAWSHVGRLHLATAPSFGHLSLVVVHFEGIRKSPEQFELRLVISY